jgi:hypothetical protein
MGGSTGCTRLSVKDRPAQQRLEVTVAAFHAEENDLDDLDPFRASVRASLARGIQVTAFWSPRAAGHPLAAMYVVAPAGPELRVHLPPAREVQSLHHGASPPLLLTGHLPRPLSPLSLRRPARPMPNTPPQYEVALGQCGDGSWERGRVQPLGMPTLAFDPTGIMPWNLPRPPLQRGFVSA